MATRINHAILHIFDFTSCVNSFSEEELDLTNRQIKSFVAKHAHRALASTDNMHGRFAEDSAFAAELSAYFAGGRDFTDLSVQIGEYFAAQLGRQEKPESCDLLVVDFEEDAPKRPAPATAADECPFDEPDSECSAEEAQEDASLAEQPEDAEVRIEPPRRYFAILLMESRQAFMHVVDRGQAGGTVNDIERHFAILPNPTQKVASYAVIDLRSMAVSFSDKARTVAGEEMMLIPDGLLQCSKEASSKETLGTVTRIVEEVAREYGANTAVAMAKAKDYVAEKAEAGEDFSCEELACEVFEDEPMRDRLAQAAEGEKLPERVAVEPRVAQRSARNHKIRTDTGIEITFPSEYSHNADFIEFVSEPNGLISIELKNIGSIENR